MALIISNSGTATATHSALGVSQVIVSGDFGVSTVDISVEADSSEKAPVHTFFGPGAIQLNTSLGTTITASIIGSDTGSIDVSVTP